MTLEDAITKGMEWDRAAAMMRSKGWLSPQEVKSRLRPEVEELRESIKKEKFGSREYYVTLGELTGLETALEILRKLRADSA